LSAEELEASINDPGPFEFVDEKPDPRSEVVALFQSILGDNVAHESVRQLIDGVVALIRRREERL
jgi:hypothetical protein